MNNNPEDGSPIRLPGKAVLPNRNYHLRRKQQRLDEKAEFESRIAEGEEQHRRYVNSVASHLERLYYITFLLILIFCKFFKITK